MIMQQKSDISSVINKLQFIKKNIAKPRMMEINRQPWLCIDKSPIFFEISCILIADDEPKIVRARTNEFDNKIDNLTLSGKIYKIFEGIFVKPLEKKHFSRIRRLTVGYVVRKMYW